MCAQACLARTQHVGDLEAELEGSNQQLKGLQQQLSASNKLVRVSVSLLNAQNVSREHVSVRLRLLVLS